LNIVKTRYLLDDEDTAFSLVEEPRFYRLKVERPAIEEQHVEEFLDRTVEWLSRNPNKGILIDFKGVRSVCNEFSVHLGAYYQDVRDKGLKVRFVNVDPGIESSISGANISVVLNVSPDKVVLSARDLLKDLSDNLSDDELMEKYGLSVKGLASLFRKMLRKGLVTRHTIAKRMGIETSEITVTLDGRTNKASVSAADVLKDLGENASDYELMHKYKLSPKGLRSLLTKLHSRGLISKANLDGRRSRAK